MDLMSVAQTVRQELPGALGLRRMDGALEKLTIQYEQGRPGVFTGRIVALFNPNEFTLTQHMSLGERKSARAGRLPQVTFTGGSLSPATLTLELFFDTYEERHGSSDLATALRANLDGTPLAVFPGATPSRKSVVDYTSAVANLIRVDQNLDRPPLCKLLWGKLQVFNGALISLSQRFTLFQTDGTPVRATLSCTFQQYVEAEASLKALDLHSADVPKTHTVRQGDTLSSIAAAAYNDPRLWRHIARANGVQNPRALRPGQVLRLPKLLP